LDGIRRDPGTEFEDVPVAGRHGVGPVASRKPVGVDSRTAGQIIVPGTADQDIVSFKAVKGIVPRAAVHVVIEVRAEQHVGPCVGIHHVAAPLVAGEKFRVVRPVEGDRHAVDVGRRQDVSVCKPDLTDPVIGFLRVRVDVEPEAEPE